MEGKVEILVIGRQRLPDGEAWEETRTLAEGICQFRMGGYDISYEEMTELGRVRTNLRLEKRSLHIRRSGAVELELVLVSGETHSAPYHTPYGTLPLTVHTHAAALSFTRTRLSARATYDLLSDNEIVSENEIDIQIKAYSNEKS